MFRYIRHMKAHTRIESLIHEAHREGRCAIVASEADRMALIRRIQSGQIVRPYHGTYADAGYWNELDPANRTMHIAKALALLHPHWVFAGPTAAAAYGFEHQWSIHRQGLYIVGSANGSGKHAYGTVRRIYMRSAPVSLLQAGIKVTSPARTLVDCGLLLPFHKALAIFDSAFARYGDMSDDVRAICHDLRHDCSVVELLLEYVDSLSENGGESLTRAIIIEEGFMIPELQRVFRDPQNPDEWYRVDFAWSLPDGRIIVAEYDGMAKYTDPKMTDRQSIRTVVNRQTRREQRLLSFGVTMIIRIDYDDLIHRERLIAKLMQAGVPYSAKPF